MPVQVKFQQADSHDLLKFEANEFDCVVDTLTISAVYDRHQHCQEIQRVLKPGGLLLLMERGASYLSVYNSWLKFRAARDLMHYGAVEHLDFEQVV